MDDTTGKVREPVTDRRRRVGRVLVLVYLAVSLSLLVSQRSAKIATSFNLNPRLFTAHHSAELYRDLDDAFKPRLFSYLLVAPFVRLDQPPSRPGSAGRISGESFEALVAGWSFVWFLATQLLLAFGLRRPLLFMLGSTTGVTFAYSLQEMVYPYDLPALFFATLVVVLTVRDRQTWLLPIVALGVGFKETIAVFAIAQLAGKGSTSLRLRRVAETLVLCLLVLVAIDLYSGRGLFAFEAVHETDAAGDPTGPKLLHNLPTALDLSTWVWAANAGLALPLFLLPTQGDRRASTFRWIGVAFAAGLFLLAGVGELRLWFELLPLCLHNVDGYLRRANQQASMQIYLQLLQVQLIN